MRDIAKVIFKLKARIRDFAGSLCSGLSGAASRAISDVLYGLCKGGDVKLTCIGRGLREKIGLKKAVERLSRNLSREDFSRSLNRRLVEISAGRIEADTLLVIDESDVQKRYARAMEHLGPVRDGSEGKIGRGYPCMNVLATEVDGGDVMPLWGSLYSVRSETCGGQNAEITWAFRDILERLDGRGIWVMDRGFDRARLLKELLALKAQFVVRLEGNRGLRFRRSEALASEIRVAMRHLAQVVLVKNGRRRVKNIEYGIVDVKLPFSEAPLSLVKFRFQKGIQTFLILTNVQLGRSGKDLLWVVKAYLSRWRIEEQNRFIKQSYNLEDIRIRSYNGLRNMTALVTACAAFVSGVVGLKPTLRILANKLLHASHRVGDFIKDFRCYALADGLKALLALTNKPWREPTPPPSPQLPLIFPTLRGLR